MILGVGYPSGKNYPLGYGYGMIFLPVGTLLDKILYPSGMAGTGAGLYYPYPPIRG